MSLTLYFLRHGETENSLNDSFCGILNPDLTPQGKEMAQGFADTYKSVDWSGIYLSPMKRTIARAKPLVVFSYDYPQKEADSQYKVEFPDLEVLNFNYRVVQLNQLNWRDCINQPNPVASALMAQMKIAAQDRPKVKAQCLRLLVTFKLDPARMQLSSGFLDTYLTLNPVEESIFNLN